MPRITAGGGGTSLPVNVQGLAEGDDVLLADNAVLEENEDGGFRALSTDAASTPLTVRGAAAQSANLMEWQDNAGTAVAYLKPTGELVIQNIEGDDVDGIILQAANGATRLQLDSIGVGFFGAAPVSQQSTISDPSGGVTQDSSARTAINQILDLLQAYGLMA